MEDDPGSVTADMEEAFKILSDEMIFLQQQLTTEENSLRIAAGLGVVLFSVIWFLR